MQQIRNPQGHKGAKRERKKRVEGWIAWITLLLLVICGLIGCNRSKVDLSAFKGELWPEATSFKDRGYEMALARTDEGNAMGCVATGTYNGFGGPLKVAVAIHPDGSIKKVLVVEHRESPSWYDRVISSDLLLRLEEKSFRDPMQLGQDLDGLTGATYTSRAIVMASKEATLGASRDILGHDVRPYLPEKRIRFALPEISLLGLLLIATIGVYKVPKRHHKTMKWVLTILGAALIGFTFNHPLTLVDINRLIMGYWPDVYHQIYWYILIFGIILIFLTTGKNTYCQYICPFGGVQECIAAMSGAKTKVSKRYNRIFNWTRRVVVLLAIMLALIYRNPGMSSYEVYGTLFKLLGTNFEVFFLSVVLVFALFIKRPWCNYLCPIPVIEHYARFIYKKMVIPFKRLLLQNKPMPHYSKPKAYGEQ